MLSKKVVLNHKTIGDGGSTFIIAEAGVNHNGDMNLARKLIEAAKEVGADCIKFQTFRAENLVVDSAPKANYQLKVTDPQESQKEMLRKLELGFKEHQELAQLSKKIGIMFFSTPYNFEDVDLLSEMGVDAFKLASIHLTELPMIKYTAQKDKPVILSTGMASMKEIIAATKEFENTGNKDLILLQCTTNYPSRDEDANLRVIPTMIRVTRAIVGYSDHTMGIEACVLSVAVGAKIIEKHFTLDKNLPGPDHLSSANPEEFAEMVRRIRQVEVLLGSDKKIVTEAEKKNVIGMKRSLASRIEIPKGTKITEKMISLMRPATGLSPNLYHQVIGATATKKILARQILREEDIKF